MRRILVRFAVLPAVCCLSTLFAQSAPVPEDRATLFAFDSFLRHIDQSQKQVMSRPTAPAAAREHFQDAYDLDSATLDKLTTAAASYAPAVAALDAEAAAIVRAAKEKYRASGASRGAAVPPPPPQLAELQERKEALIRQTLDSIENAIGPAQLRYVVYRLRFHISVRPAGAETSVR